MEKEIHFRLNKELYNYIEKYQIENNLEDLSDSIREITKNQKNFEEKGFLFRIKKALFN